MASLVVGPDSRGAVIYGNRDRPKTGCIPPSERDKSGPGIGAAGWRAALWLIPALAALLLLAGAAGIGFGVGFFTIAVDSFLNWWINRRLLCLSDNECAIGIVWSVEPPGLGHKAIPEVLDNDYSLNLLLSPADPGYPDTPASIQNFLVREHESIKREGLPTFGYVTVAATHTCPENSTTRGPITIEESAEDPDQAPIDSALTAKPTNLSSWKEFIPPIDMTKWSKLWNAPDASTSLPNCQLLHCEFEGNNIPSLRPVMIVGGVIGGITLVGASGAIAAGGAAAAAAAAALFFLFLLLLILLTWFFSHDGSPSDAASDPQSGSVNAVPGGDLCAQEWDKDFDLIGVQGRWIYDYGHSRGWNELHPVKYVQLLSNRDWEARQQALRLPAIRPRTESEVEALRLKFCESIYVDPNANRTSGQADGLVAVHPSLAGSEIR